MNVATDDDRGDSGRSASFGVVRGEAFDTTAETIAAREPEASSASREAAPFVGVSCTAESAISDPRAIEAPSAAETPCVSGATLA